MLYDGSRSQWTVERQPVRRRRGGSSRGHAGGECVQGKGGSAWAAGAAAPPRISEVGSGAAWPCLSRGQVVSPQSSPRGCGAQGGGYPAWGSDNGVATPRL